MQITRKHFAILIGTLFAISLSADPVIHSLEDEDHHHEIIECQACESESSEAYDHYFLESYALNPITLSSQEKRILSFISKGFSVRAPPNS